MMDNHICQPASLFTGQTKGCQCSNGKIQVLKIQVDETKTIMQQNLERFLLRGERLDDLVGKSCELEESARSFRTSARRTKRQMCLENCRCIALTILVVLVVTVCGILLILYEVGVFSGTSISVVTENRPPTGHVTTGT